MNMRRKVLFAAAAISAFALLAGEASARTICRADGVCFNTSGAPIAPWQQPAFRGGYADEGYYGGPPYPYHHHHYHRYWHPAY
jgi:hypothetical protein